MFAVIALCFAAGPPATVPQPARITATFRDAKLVDVFAEVRKQTGSRLMIDENHGNHHAIKRTFTGTFRNATFWEVVDAICRHCGSCNLLPPDGIKIYLWPAPPKENISSSHGLFRITATEVRISRSVLLLRGDGDGYRKSELKVYLHLAIEPGHDLRVGEARVKVAEDDRKRSLLPIGHDWRSPDPWSTDSEVILYAKAPPAGAKRIALLKGTIRVKLPAGTAGREVDVPFELRDIPLP